MGILSRLAASFGTTKAVIISIAALAAVGGGIALAVVVMVSNTLLFGPYHVGNAVSLSPVEGLPSNITIGQEYELRFDITANQAVSDATLWFLLKAGSNLTNPGIASVKYRHPGGSQSTVSLASSGGDLKGALMSNWNIPAGYDETGRGYVTFLSGTPADAYYIELWVEGTLGSSGGTQDPPSGSTSSFTLNADTDGFVGASGTNADGTSIAGASNPTLTVTAGDTVELTAVRQDSLHNIAVYSAPCQDGFCDTNLLSGARTANVTSSSSQATISFTFPTSATTLYYICDYHPGSMSGTIQAAQ